MLAMAAYQNKDKYKAINYWRRLLALMPADAPEAQQIKEAILKAQEN